VAHSVLYVYTTVVCLLMSGTQCTVRVHYSGVCTAECHTEYCTCTLQWCVYCLVAHRVLTCTLQWCVYCLVAHRILTCTLQWFVYCLLAHRVLYVYTTLMCLLLSGTQNTVRVHYSDVCTAEWHTDYCTCNLQWCVYCWLAHRYCTCKLQWCVYCWVAHSLLYVYTTVMCVLLSGTQSTVLVHYSDVYTAEWHTVYRISIS
jgi:hypothetical protein